MIFNRARNTVVFFALAFFGLSPSPACSELHDREEYETLRQRCNGSSCCESSVRRMESSGSWLASRNGTCPEGTKHEKLRCLESLSWCESEEGGRKREFEDQAYRKRPIEPTPNEKRSR